MHPACLSLVVRMAASSPPTSLLNILVSRVLCCVVLCVFLPVVSGVLCLHA